MTCGQLGAYICGIYSSVKSVILTSVKRPPSPCGHFPQGKIGVCNDLRTVGWLTGRLVNWYLVMRTLRGGSL
jgi:hypothetical protein